MPGAVKEYELSRYPHLLRPADAVLRFTQHVDLNVRQARRALDDPLKPVDALELPERIDQVGDANATEQPVVPNIIDRAISGRSVERIPAVRLVGERLPFGRAKVEHNPMHRLGSRLRVDINGTGVGLAINIDRKQPVPIFALVVGRNPASLPRRQPYFGIGIASLP